MFSLLSMYVPIWDFSTQFLIHYHYNELYYSVLQPEPIYILST